MYLVHVYALLPRREGGREGGGRRGQAQHVFSLRRPAAPSSLDPPSSQCSRCPHQAPSTQLGGPNPVVSNTKLSVFMALLGATQAVVWFNSSVDGVDVARAWWYRSAFCMSSSAIGRAEFPWTRRPHRLLGYSQQPTPAHVS